MQSTGTIWLVRTRSGEVLGPFTQRQLLEEFERKTFSAEDEIAPAQGYWISAQTLQHHETDEFTTTMTKSRAVTGSISLTPTPAATATPSTEPASTQQNAALDLKNLAPPQPAPPRMIPVVTLPRPAPASAASPKRRWKQTGVFLGVAVVVAWAILFRKPSQGPDAPAVKAPAAPPAAATGSPFLAEIYRLIDAGERKVALQKLTEYHESRRGRDEVGYLVPYAALLLLEGESSARAKRMLDQALAAGPADSLRAQAHLWLGYLMLSQEQGDMGINHFQETLQIQPKDAAARFNLGRAYLKQGDYQKALEFFQFAELEVPDLWLVHIYKGRARAALSDMQEARFSFMTAVQSAQDRWLTYIYFSLFLMGLREHGAAQNALTKMLTRDPHYELNAPPPFGFFQERINYAEYESAFLEVMKNGSPKVRELGRLYINYLRNGPESAEAKRLVRFAETGGGLMGQVIALKVLLDVHAPPAAVDRAASRLPANLSEFGYYAYVLRGEARLRLGRLEDAHDDFKRAVLLEPKSAIARLAYANFLKKANRTGEARKELKQVLTYHPHYIPAIVAAQDF